MSFWKRPEIEVYKNWKIDSWKHYDPSRQRLWASIRGESRSRALAYLFERIEQTSKLQASYYWTDGTKVGATTRKDLQAALSREKYGRYVVAV